MSSAELFELSLLGGSFERRYRKHRPDVERLPWDGFDVQAFPVSQVVAAQKLWTMASFQEHRSAASAAETVRALVLARAPLDLVAAASRFILDELTHAELCARVAMGLGGAAALFHDPRQVIYRGDSNLSPLLEAADLVVRTYCVEESVAAPLLRATQRAAKVPLTKAVFGILAKDEATHAALGWAFLDWAADRLSDSDRAHLGRSAGEVLLRFRAGFPDPTARIEDGPGDLGGLTPMHYARAAEKHILRDVAQPLLARGIAPTA